MSSVLAPRVFSFVIVTYNSADTIEACLHSIVTNTGRAFQIIVVDNSPSNETVTVVQEFIRQHPHANLRLLRTGENLGFAKACNLGARHATGEFLFFLNPDTELMNDTASILAACFDEHLDAVAAGPAIMDNDGTVTRTCRNLPTLTGVLLDVTGLDRWIGAYKLTQFPHDQPDRVQQIIGAAILMRRCVYEQVGGMDERFFIYFEEVDLCKRLLEAGGAIWFWPQAGVRHLAGSSCEVDTVRASMIGRLRHSRALYFQKHFGQTRAALVRLLNRVEGIAKAWVSSILWFGTRKSYHREKASGFWAVARNLPTVLKGARVHRVLAFTVKPVASADTRYRITQFQGMAHRDHIDIDHRSLMGPRYFEWQIKHRHGLLRAALFPFLYLRRAWQVLFLAPRYDTVWISREMVPLGPPLLEQCLCRRCKHIVFDVDDALHLPDKASSSLLPHLLRDSGKFARMAASYTTVVCGNQFLAGFYRGHGAHVEIVPTVVDDLRYASVAVSRSPMPRIGWVGTPLNRHHLDSLLPAFAALARDRNFELVVVGLNEPLSWDIPNIRYMPWHLNQELHYFTQFDIGIMPLKDTPFARGKCAFKLIQYMAAGLPVVASSVGANCEVVRHGWNGYLAGTMEEWTTALRSLIDDPDLGESMGHSGRRLVQDSYSIRAVWPRYAAILQGS